MIKSVFSVFSSRVYVAALCLMPLVTIIMPRFTSLGPSLAALIGLAAFYTAHKKLPSFSKHVLGWAILFPALMALSALWSVDPENSFMRAVKTLPITLSGAALWALGTMSDGKEADTFHKYFPLAVIVAGILLALQLYVQDPFFQIFHPFLDPEKEYNLSPLNRSVVVYILAAFVAMFCLKLEQKNNLALLAGLAFVTGLILFATSSQSSQLAFFLGALFFAAFPYRMKFFYVILAAMLAVLIISTPFLTQYLFHQFADMPVADLFKRGYTSQRLEIWDFVSRRALESSWIGHGAEATRNIKDFDSAKLYWPTTKALHPHNFAVQIWIEFGLLGAILTALFFADLLRGLSRMAPEHARNALPLFMISLSVAATGYGLWQGWWLGLFCLQMAYLGVLLRKNT